MKATEAKFLGFLKKSPQFVIPIYQRTYSWTEKECRQLWDDIIRAGSNEGIFVHFIGSIVYIEEGLSQVSHQAPLLVIDGQQRLTTVTLLLAALAEALSVLPDGSPPEQLEPVDGFSARKIRNYYLVNPEEDGERHYKLILSQTDKPTLIQILAGKAAPTDASIRVQQNFTLFQELIAGCKGDLTALCHGLAKLVVVDIALNRDQDNPQLIFESMNSTGRELSQADLIRNFILMGLEPALQTRLYEEYWRPMEVAFGQEAYTTEFDAFMRHYLTVKTGDIPRLNEVYEAFKGHARDTGAVGAKVEPLVKEVRDYARYFCAMALGAETYANLKQPLHDLRELKVDVAYPFLLELYRDYDAGQLSKADFIAVIRLIEAYVFRRAICAIPTNSMNKTFSTFTKSVRKDRYLESVQAHFLTMPSYRRFPRDEEFMRDIQTRDLYHFRSRSYWLRRFENFDRKERVPVDEYTIEHILPQNENLSQAWREALGHDWQRIREEKLHTLGNLTLTAYNSEYSDRPFLEKRDMHGGFAMSPLNVNKGLGQLSVWDEAAIKARAARMAKIALNVWPEPALEEQTLAEYRPKKHASSYGRDDHPNLQKAPMRELFDALRTEVLALDPCVTEEYLKHYVAYKAETNFVEIVPQVQALRLSINMPYADAVDPRALAKDVSKVGRWGNGEVEFHLRNLDELAYAMGLVRQSLERQLGGEETIA
jgi:uncharacterized protein with ParB-like and HNH nuclease domain/predicted transport protein